MHKKEIANLLANEDLPALLALAECDPQRLFRRLIGLAYDKNDVMCWRAIEAVGAATGALDRKRPELVRNLAQRLLWMMRDESGNNPGSAPEMLGEIVRNSPESCADLAPIIGSFDDEAMLRRGVLRALWRMAERRPELVAVREDSLRSYLLDEDPVVRAYAVLLTGLKGEQALRSDLTSLRQDQAEAIFFDGSGFRPHRLSDLAAQALERLEGKVNHV